MRRTLILVKPDAFERNLTGEVIARFERKGLRIAALKLMQVDRELAEQHYDEHASKPFFPDLIEFITRGPLVAIVLEGEDAVPAARSLIGATNPIEAAPGSIRGDFALEVTYNLVHGSDSDNTAEREIGLWFPGALRPRRRLTCRWRRSRLDAGPCLARRSGGRSSNSSASRSRSPRRTSRRTPTATRRRRCSGTRGARRARWPAGRPGRDVLGVDTEVLPGRAPVRQAGDEREARGYLERLSGRTHEVLQRGRADPRRRGATGGRAHEVTFRALDAALIDWYLASGEWRDRRAATPSRGAEPRWSASIDGDYWNVVGLPVALLLDIAPWLLHLAATSDFRCNPCVSAAASCSMGSVLFAAADAPRWRRPRSPCDQG